MPSLLWVNQFAVLPKDGGGTRHFELARELVRLGWSVTILASDLHLHQRRYTRRSDPAFKGCLTESLGGVEVKRLWAAAYETNNWRRAWNWLTFGSSVKRASRTLPKPDVIIGSSPQLFAARAAADVARSLRVPFVLEVRDLWPESLVAIGGRRGPAYRYLEHVAKDLYRRSERIIVLAKGVRDYLAQAGVPADKCAYVPNGVDIHTIVPVETAAEPSSTRSVFVYAGAHGPANGLDRVLDAAELLRDEAVEFLLIGDGPIKRQLVDDARRRDLQNVIFRDPVSKTELVGIYAGAAAGLMVLRDSPLFSFGVSPNKLFDYFAAGLPVICNVPGEVAGMVTSAGAGRV